MFRPDSSLTAPLTQVSPHRLRQAESVRRELAEILDARPLREPVLRRQRLTINRVELSGDLKCAKIFLAPPPPETRAEVLTALRRAKLFLRKRLADKRLFRFVPELRFYLDANQLALETLDEALAQARLRS